MEGSPLSITCVCHTSNDEATGATIFRRQLAYREHIIEIMNETGYFPVPRPPTAAWGRILRVHRTWIQRWVNDGNDFPKATFLGNIRRQHPMRTENTSLKS